MMEIKFKVWCKGTSDNSNFKSKRWFEPHNYIFNKYFPIYRFFGEQDEEIKEFFKLLQFTGLYDKEGVEIYEDDILEVNYKGELVQFRVYKVTGGFAFKSPAYWKDISDLKRGDELILDYLANPQNISWIKDNCRVKYNWNEKI